MSLASELESCYNSHGAFSLIRYTMGKKELLNENKDSITTYDSHKVNPKPLEKWLKLQSQRGTLYQESQLHNVRADVWFGGPFICSSQYETVFQAISSSHNTALKWERPRWAWPGVSAICQNITIKVFTFHFTCLSITTFVFLKLSKQTTMIGVSLLENILI